jgi:hypothetical protein
MQCYSLACCATVLFTVRVLRWLPSVALLLPWLFGPPSPSNEVRIRDLAGPTSFRLLDWETVNLGQRAERLASGLFGDRPPTTDDGTTLRGYFGTPVAARATLRPAAEAALERVIGGAYGAAGLTRSMPLQLPSDQLFPPLLVALTSPPNVLVIAPRTELRVIQSSVMQATETPAQERLEASADSTGVSSLIAPIGGLATYPSMVLDEDSAERVLSAVAHEWLHQYLIFYPLGKGYFQSQQTREINETTADLVGQEIGARVAADLRLAPPAAAAASTGPARPPAFDFRAFMRQTRVDTERLLADGQVDQAEALMRQRRDELQQHGYRLRKINQAYFALYGSYGDGFAASPANPIPALLRTLREHSPTLADFIFGVRDVMTVDELRRAVAG